MMNNQVFEGEFFSFSNESVQHDIHTHEYILHNVGIYLFLLWLTVGDGIISCDVLPDKFSLKYSCNLSSSLYFSDVVFVDLCTNSFQELFLLPTLIFHLLFDYLGEFSAVLRIGGNDLELSSFFLSKGL